MTYESSELFPLTGYAIDVIVRDIHKAYNPVVFFGNGHRLVSIADVIEGRYREARPENMVCRITGSAFCQRLISDIRAGTQLSFLTRYKHHDLMIIEGLDAFGGREAAQEELYTLVDYLYEHGNRVVATAGKAPFALGLTDRVRTQFEGGLLCDIDRE